MFVEERIRCPLRPLPTTFSSFGSRKKFGAARCLQFQDKSQTTQKVSNIEMARRILDDVITSDVENFKKTWEFDPIKFEPLSKNSFGYELISKESVNKFSQCIDKSEPCCKLVTENKKEPESSTSDNSCVSSAKSDTCATSSNPSNQSNDQEPVAKSPESSSEESTCSSKNKRKFNEEPDSTTDKPLIKKFKQHFITGKYEHEISTLVRELFNKVQSRFLKN